MARNNKNNQNAEQRLEALQKQLLANKGSAEKVILDPEELFQFAITLQSKARQVKDPLEKGNLYSESCFYFYLAQEHGKREADKLRRQVCGEWASRIYSHEYCDFLCGQGGLTSDEATHFCADVISSLLESTRECFLQELGLGVFMVPDHVLAAFCAMRDFRFDDSGGKEMADPFSFVQDLLGRIQGCDFEDNIGRDLSGFYSWCMAGDGKEEPFFENFFGIPSEAAFAIGMAYLEGKWLKPSRVMAARFIRYAVLTGSPRACLAWALFFDDLGLVSEDGDDGFFECYCGTLFHGIMLCLLQYNPALKSRISGMQYAVVNGKSKIRIDAALMLSLGGALSAHYEKNRTVGSSPDPGAIINLLAALKKSDKNDAEIDASVRITGARLLNILQNEEPLLKKLNDFVDEYYRTGKKRQTATAHAPSFELIKPLLGKNVKNQAINLCLLDLDGIIQEAGIIPHLDALCKENVADAIFKRATLAWVQEGKEGKLLEAFVKSANCGYPISMYNLAIFLMQEGKSSEALSYAEKALFGGIPQTFFILYQLGAHCKGKKYELACTCLRYAAEYLLPTDAVKELNSLRQSGRYKPLPFMKELEKLEEQAQNDPVCACLLGTMYARGMIVPCDKYQTIRWYRQAVSLGDHMSVENLFSLYVKEHWFEGADRTAVTDMCHALEISSRYGIGTGKDFSAESSKAENALKKILVALRNGKTWLEQMLYMRNLKGDVISAFGLDNADFESDKEPDELVQYEANAREYIETMGDCRMLDFMGEGLLFETHAPAIKALLIMTKGCDPRMYKLNSESKALTALRGFLPLDLKQCRNLLLQSMNNDSTFAKALYKVSWDVLNLQNTGYDPQKKHLVKLIQEKDKEKIQSDDYFDLSVEQ